MAYLTYTQIDTRIIPGVHLYKFPCIKLVCNVLIVIHMQIPIATDLSGFTTILRCTCYHEQLVGVNGTGSVKDTMLFGVVKPHTGITWTSSLSPVWFSFIFSLENKDCEIKVQGAEEAGEAMNIALIVVGEYFI